MFKKCSSSFSSDLDSIAEFQMVYFPPIKLLIKGTIRTISTITPCSLAVQI